MVIFYLVRPKFAIQGFLVVMVVLAGWILIFLARENIPKTISLLFWEPASFFPNSPTLLIDKISWAFSLGLISLTIGLTITSIAQLGQSVKSTQEQKSSILSNKEQLEPTTPEKKVSVPSEILETGITSNWSSWAGILIFTSLGLVAVSAGNMLTLLLAWAALDVVELAILLNQVLQSQLRERIVLAFSARMAGIGIALLAGIIPWSHGISLTFDSINQSTSIYLVLAAGLRLGVLPIHLPLFQNIPIRRSLGTILRLVPTAASYILLVRVAEVGVLGPATPYLLGFVALGGLYAGFHWMTASEELDGRPFWIIGTGSMAVASAIVKQPMACVAWSIASILTGGLIFSTAIRHKYIFPISLIGFICLSALPFTPTWAGTDLYQYSSFIINIINMPVFYLLTIAFLLVHSLLLGGFTRHSLRGIISTTNRPIEHLEQWVWFLYPIGLIFIIVTHILIGFLLQLNLHDIPLESWVMGAAAVIISVMIYYLFNRFSPVFLESTEWRNLPPRRSIYSIESIYRYFWKIYRFLTRMTSMISTILEGDGGILWALVLFTLIFVFLQR